MTKAILIFWLLLPVGALAYHFGPGQSQMLLDEVAALVAQAEEHVERARATASEDGDLAAREAWSAADRAYAQALKLLPGERVRTGRELRLERAKVGLNISKLPEANSSLESLVREMSEDPGSSQTLLSEVRAALANSQYYLTWLLRLEGAGREAWEPEIEAARQTYKLLAEQASARGDETALLARRQDLESTIRLARMDLTELQGLPIPNQ